MTGSERRVDLTMEERAFIAARLDVRKDRPRSETLLKFGLTEDAWAAACADWNRRLVQEIRERSGMAIRIEDRYPLTSAYAKAYSDAVREARAEIDRDGRDEREEDATVRIAPESSRDEPLTVLGASNRAASWTRARSG
jgi:hypothetical protein